jgi:transcriptional regulator with XRE-family HTH domain
MTQARIVSPRHVPLRGPAGEFREPAGSWESTPLVEKSTAVRARHLAMRSSTSSPAFNRWLQAQLKARKLTQRQLAQKSGVDHSTVSRLVRGERVPSLRTAALLARGLGWPAEIGRHDDRSFGASFSSTARVEYALRSDEVLDERRVRAIMDVYLAARVKSVPSADTAAPNEASARRPVPIVTSVGGLRPSARTGSSPAAARARSQ